MLQFLDQKGLMGWSMLSIRPQFSYINRMCMAAKSLSYENLRKRGASVKKYRKQKFIYSYVQYEAIHVSDEKISKHDIF